MGERLIGNLELLLIGTEFLLGVQNCSQIRL